MELGVARLDRRTVGADELGARDAEGRCDLLLDLLHGRRPARLGPMRDQLGDQLAAERLRGERGVGDHLGQRAVEAADIGVDAPRKLGEGVAVLWREPRLARQVLKDGEASGEVGWFDWDGQAPLEAIAQPRLQGRELAGQAVG